MQCPPPGEHKKQGILQFLLRLEQYLNAKGVYELSNRQLYLGWCIQSDTCRQQAQAVWTTPSPAASWQTVRHRLLSLFCPGTWIQDLLTQWRASLTQNAQRATVWLSNFLFWQHLVEHIVPGQQAITPEFRALLLRAGVTDKVEAKLAAHSYAVYDPDATHAAIMTVVQHLGYGQGALTEKEVATVRRAALTRDAHVEAALKQVEAVQACMKRLQYAGALADWLQRQGVTQIMFDERRARKQCVCCGETDHFLYTCPQYSTEAVATQAADRAKHEVRRDTRRVVELARDRARTREDRVRGLVHERPRDAVNMHTRAGQQRAHQQQFTPNKPHGAARVAAGQDRASPPERQQHYAKSTVDEAYYHSDAVDSTYESDASDGMLEAYAAADDALAGNGAEDQH